MRKDISDKVYEILKDERVINILKENFEKNHGFPIGKIEYFDDIQTIIMYGITLENENSSQAKILSYKLSPYSIKEGNDFKLEEYLPEIPRGAIKMKYPNSSTINQSMKEILKNPKIRRINYAPFLKQS